MILESDIEDKDQKDVAIIDTPVEADKLEAEEKEPPIRADDCEFALSTPVSYHAS